MVRAPAHDPAIVTASPASRLQPSDPPRSPEGVVVEVSASLPPTSAVSDARGVIVLAEPPPDEAIRDVLFAYFDALRRDDKEGIAALFSEGAVRIDALRGHQGDRAAVLSLVYQWMRSHDRSRVAPAEIVVGERIDRYSVVDLAAAKQKKPDDMGPLDVFVRLTMPPQRVATDKLFEEAVVFLLRPEAGKLRIVTTNEESAAPLL